MKSIVFIVPYFGHFNNYFDWWLKSCAHNHTIHWIIFTDCRDKHAYPDNVKVSHISFSELKERIQSLYDFKICLDQPYKLCDFRPAYGDIFYDYIKDYDFWGYCDIDLIWGDMRKFLTETILECCDKIGERGHCCLMRNTERMRLAYQYESQYFPTYKEVFTSCLAYCFDEHYAFGRYCKECNDIKTFDNLPLFDVGLDYDDCRVSMYQKHDFVYQAHNVFEYQKGMLLLWYVKYRMTKEYCREIFYVHFQKRKMEVCINAEQEEHYIIGGFRFLPYCKIDNKKIKELDPKSWKKRLWFSTKWKKVKAEVLHLGGVKYYKYTLANLFKRK